MKVLFIAVLKNDQCRNKVLKEMEKINQNGAVIASTSIRNALFDSDVEPLPEFGALRHVTQNVQYTKSMFMIVIDEDQVSEISDAVKRGIKGLKDNHCMMYTLPIGYFEETEG